MISKQAELRKFPYPYRAAFAICCDCDHIHSLDVYLEFMRYLNGHRETVYGTGLGMEIGTSFWFFNGTSSAQLSYFKSISSRESAFAPFCRELLRSGYIDILHTYGDFDSGGFTRKHAQIAVDELRRNDIVLTTWVNHGNPLNRQNLGFLEGCCGSDPKKPEYHFDLLFQYGIRFICTRYLSHVIGQEGHRTFNVIAKTALQRAMNSVKYREIPVPVFDEQNRLLIPSRLQDGHNVWEFQRFVNDWGREKNQDIRDLRVQIRPRNIRRLLKNGGFMLVYSHMFEGLEVSRVLPEAVRRNFEYIAALYRDGQLLVTTTSRLLRYREMCQSLCTRLTTDGEILRITIDPEMRLWGEHAVELKREHLDGLTFYCGDPKNTEIWFRGEKIDTVINPPDDSGRDSLSIPWRPLAFPAL